jgi:hypothetical protein
VGLYAPSTAWGNQKALLSVPSSEFSGQAVTMMVFPSQDVYEVNVGIYHIGGEVNYQLLAYNADRVFTGASSSQLVKVRGSYTISFRSSVGRPIRSVILQGISSSLADSSTARRPSETDSVVLLESVEIFTSP